MPRRQRPEKTATAKLAEDADYRTRLEDAEQAIATGEFGLADLQKAAGDGGWIRNTEDFQRLFDLIAKRPTDTLDYDRAVSRYTDPAYRFDPTSPEDRRAVDLIFERGIAGDADSDEEAQRLLAQIVARTGIAPALAPTLLASGDTGTEDRGERAADVAPEGPPVHLANANEEFSDKVVPQLNATKKSVIGAVGEGIQLAQADSGLRRPPPKPKGRLGFALTLFDLLRQYLRGDRSGAELDGGPEDEADAQPSVETQIGSRANSDQEIHESFGPNPLRGGSANDAGDFSNEEFASDKDYLRYRRIVHEGVPQGFKDRQHVDDAAETLSEGLSGDGFEKGLFAIRGSSVTGRKYVERTQKYDGPPFDTRKRSDWDLAVVDAALFKHVVRHAKRQRIGLRGSQTRTEKLGPNKLEDLGLDDLADRVAKLEKASGREITIVIYKHADDLWTRGPAMWLTRR